MEDDDWDIGYARALALFLNGDAISTPGPRGERISDDHFLLLFNASPEAIDFAMPNIVGLDAWTLVVDTSAPSTQRPMPSGEAKVTVAPWAVMALTRPVPPEVGAGEVGP